MICEGAAPPECLPPRCAVVQSLMEKFGIGFDRIGRLEVRPAPRRAPPRGAPRNPCARARVCSRGCTVSASVAARCRSTQVGTETLVDKSKAVKTWAPPESYFWASSEYGV